MQYMVYITKFMIFTCDIPLCVRAMDRLFQYQSQHNRFY